MKILKFLSKIFGYEMCLIGKTIDNKPIYSINKKIIDRVVTATDYVNKKEIGTALAKLTEDGKQEMLDKLTNPRKNDNSGIDLELLFDDEKLKSIRRFYYLISSDNTLPKIKLKNNDKQLIFEKPIVSEDGKKLYYI